MVSDGYLAAGYEYLVGPMKHQQTKNTRDNDVLTWPDLHVLEDTDRVVIPPISILSRLFRYYLFHDMDLKEKIDAIVLIEATPTLHL